MQGSVYKRCSKCGGNVSARACAKCRTTKTNWAYRTYVGKDAKGGWIEERRGGFATRRDAERALTNVAASVSSGSYVRPSGLTLAEYLLDGWLPATAPPRVRHETWEDRRRNLEHHVIAQLGDVKLQELNAAHLNRLYGELLTEGRTDHDGGLSPTSVRRIHAMVRKALNDAVRWGLLERNVATLADPPPARVIQASRRRSMQTWSEQELATFLERTATQPLHPLWLVTAFTGMRRSEVLGLRWDAIDLEARVLSVRSTVIPGEDGYELAEEQKSTGSARTIYMDDATVTALRRQRVTVAKAKVAAGPAWQEHGLVFPRVNGTWWNPPAVSLAFRRAVRTADVPKIRFHDLRHTHATLLLRAGVNPKVVSERLGHSSVAFTLDTYAHVTPGMQPEAVELFRRLVLGPERKLADDPEDVA